MKKNHILIDYNAISEIAQNRHFSSKEFAAGSKLLSYLLVDEIEAYAHEEVEGLIFISSKNGIYITLRKNISKKGLIIDCNTFDGFSSNKDTALYLFQKIIRLLYKHFNGFLYGRNEYFFAENGTLVLFPYQNTPGYRIIISSDVDKKRQAPRNNNYVLLFNCGNENDYKVSSDNIRTLKSAMDHFIQANEITQKKLIDYNYDISDPGLVQHTQLSSVLSPIDPNIGFETWKKYYLTDTQKQFIDSETDSPVRLEGAAGTGKTLSMVLKCISILEKYHLKGIPCSIIFISHSVSAKKHVENIFNSNCNDILHKNIFESNGSVKIIFNTLQEWSINFIGKSEWINEVNLLELDAYDSRLHQSLFIESMIKNLSSDIKNNFWLYCSDEFKHYFEHTEIICLTEMLKFEFGVNIKGRANLDMNEYMSLNRSKNEIPMASEGDYKFIFYLFNIYQEYLTNQNLYDVDDIIIQALNSLNSTIWKRVRKDFGHDFVFIDETHMFNLNELSIFQYLTKNSDNLRITFAIDRSQAVGDRSFLDESINKLFENHMSEKLNLNFRSSQDIIQIASDIVNSGTMMFANFSNNLTDIYGSFNYSDESNCTQSYYLLFENSELIFEQTYNIVESICRKRKVSRSKILIIGCDNYHVSQLKQYAKKTNKPFEFIQNRGDTEIIKFAEQQNRFIICDIDSSGGLEFDGVIIVGIDGQNVPPKQSEKGVGSAIHFQNYAWHNRLYVAITRARYFVHFVGELSHGISPLLNTSINKGLINVKDGYKNCLLSIENNL